MTYRRGIYSVRFMLGVRVKVIFRVSFRVSVVFSLNMSDAIFAR